MQKIYTADAPEAIGPYSQAVRTGSLLFTSGQIAIDPKTGEVVEGGIAEQTQRICENLKAVLEAAGSSLERVAPRWSASSRRPASLPTWATLRRSTRCTANTLREGPRARAWR